MPIDTTPSTVATNALQAIPFGSLIGGPLNACIEAQATAAKTTYEFIKSVGFDANGKAKSVVFEYQRDGKIVNLTVPLLVIVPIPYIQVDTIGIDFMANISASSSSVQENTSSENMGGELDAEGRIGWGPFSLSARFKANYSSKKDSKATQESKYSVEYTMNVHVGASQSNMPAGLAAVLNILTGSLSGSEPGGELLISPTSTAIADRASAAYFEITVKDDKGLLMPDQLVSISLKPADGGLVLLPMAISPGTPDGTPTAVQAKAKSDSSGIVGVTVQIDPKSPQSAANALKLTASTAIKMPDGKTGPVKTVTGQLGVTAQRPLPLPAGATLKASAEQLSGSVGGSAKLKAILTDDKQAGMTGRVVRFRSDDNTTVMVTPDQAVTGPTGETPEVTVSYLRAGTACLNLECEGLLTPVSVKVKDEAKPTLTPSKSSVEVKADAPAKLTATLKDGDGKPMAKKKIDASMNDTRYASIEPAQLETDDNGQTGEFTVKFVAAGSTFALLKYGDTSAPVNVAAKA